MKINCNTRGRSRFPHKTQIDLSSRNTTSKSIIYVSVHLCSEKPASHLCVHELHCDCSIHHNYQFKSTIQSKLDLSQQFWGTSELIANCIQQQIVFHKPVKFSCKFQHLSHCPQIGLPIAPGHITPCTLPLPHSLCTRSWQTEATVIKGLLAHSFWLGEEGC